MSKTLGTEPKTPATPAPRHPISGLPEIGHSLGRRVAPVELFATVALALSTLVMVTAVSIGIARADVFAARADADAAPLAIALFIGLLLSGMGGLTALMANDRTRRD